MLVDIMRTLTPDFPPVLLLWNCVVEMGTQAGTCYTSVLLESCAPRHARAHCCKSAAIFFVYIGGVAASANSISCDCQVSFLQSRVALGSAVQIQGKCRYRAVFSPDHHIGDAQSLLREFKWLNTGFRRRIWCSWHSDKLAIIAQFQQRCSWHSDKLAVVAQFQQHCQVCDARPHESDRVRVPPVVLSCTHHSAWHLLHL